MSLATSILVLTYALSPDWTEKFSGPPPSDSGYYVLAQSGPRTLSKGQAEAVF